MYGGLAGPFAFFKATVGIRGPGVPSGGCRVGMCQNGMQFEMEGFCCSIEERPATNTSMRRREAICVLAESQVRKLSDRQKRTKRCKFDTRGFGTTVDGAIVWE